MWVKFTMVELTELKNSMKDMARKYIYKDTFYSSFCILNYF